MRNYDVMMKLIMDKAQSDKNIRAVLMWGSRVDPDATHDQYCDYDIVYIIDDIRPYTNDDTWVSYFGDILIMQKAEDWYKHPYDYESKEVFMYLMQFTDGNRIDLCLTDVTNVKHLEEAKEPLKVLLDKDDAYAYLEQEASGQFNIEKPSNMEFFNTCNEFWWLSLNVAKGLCREELMYVKYFMEHLQMDMFLKMLSWKIGYEYSFAISTGKAHKYLKRYLTDEELNRLHQMLPSGAYEDIWKSLVQMGTWFNELAVYISSVFSFTYNELEAMNVLTQIRKMRKECDGQTLFHN